MKVCIVSHTSEKAGAERMLLRMVDGLAERGVDVSVLLPGDGPLKQALAVRRVPHASYPYRWWAARGLDLWRRVKDVARLHALPQVVSQLRRWDVDVILSNTSVVPIGALAAYILRRPHVWYIHEFGREDHDLSFSLGFRWTSKVIAGLSTLVIVNSRAVEKHYSQYIPQRKIRMIYDGVELASKGGDHCNPHSEQGIPRLVLVGSYHRGKGQMTAIQALKRLIDQQVKAELVLVGPTTEAGYLGQLKGAATELGLDEFISFFGYQDDPAPIVGEADLVLMCSRSEAFGLVTVEGMKLGKPVVGARGGATPELIKDGFNGFLYTVDDPSDLAAKIRYLLENPDVAKQMGENGRRWADETFSTERYLNELLEVLNDAARRRRPFALESTRHER